MIRAVAAAPPSEVRNILLGTWGFTPDLKPAPIEYRDQSRKALETYIDPPKQEDIPL